MPRPRRSAAAYGLLPERQPDFGDGLLEPGQIGPEDRRADGLAHRLRGTEQHGGPLTSARPPRRLRPAPRGSRLSTAARRPPRQLRLRGVEDRAPPGSPCAPGRPGRGWSARRTPGAGRRPARPGPAPRRAACAARSGVAGVLQTVPRLVSAPPISLRSPSSWRWPGAPSSRARGQVEVAHVEGHHAEVAQDQRGPAQVAGCAEPGHALGVVRGRLVLVAPVQGQPAESAQAAAITLDVTRPAGQVERLGVHGLRRAGTRRGCAPRRRGRPGSWRCRCRRRAPPDGQALLLVGCRCASGRPGRSASCPAPSRAMARQPRVRAAARRRSAPRRASVGPDPRAAHQPERGQRPGQRQRQGRTPGCGPTRQAHSRPARMFSRSASSRSSQAA